MTLPIKAELLVELGNWQRGLTKANKQLTGFGKSMKTISNGVKAAWAGVAVLGVNAVTDAIMDMAKSAAQDNKSMALLNKQLSNSWKATDKTKASVEDLIGKMSMMTGIADDNLRPAFAKIASQTKSVSKANKMFALALDISADRGVSLDTAVKAVTKSMAGNEKAFNRLYPAAEKSGDAIAYVTKKSAGMAKIAGDNDPFAKLTETMNNFQEKLGRSFLPLINQFSDWLASEESQKALDDIAKKVEKFGKWFASKEGQEAFKGWMEDLKTMLQLAGAFLDIVGEVGKLLKSSTDKNAGDTKIGAVARAYKSTPFQHLSPRMQNETLSRTGNMSTIGNTTINMTVNGTVSGNEVVTALTRYAKGKGIPMSKLLR